MPPKQKGHNARGKKKIFRHAIENVHISGGYISLGNVSLQLAAGVQHANAADEESGTLTHSAFYLELNQQLLSHSSKDFTRFRWEVLELCETREILRMHHREIAEALLARLLQRSEGVYSGHSSTAKAEGKTDRGLTVEGYDAFLRLTIAFARDLQEKFLPYFEVFHQAVHAGLYDKNGNVIASAERVHMLYSVQAVWCREMQDFWEDSRHITMVRRILHVYVQQLRDTKEYIRRLSGELLAFLCRLCRTKVLPLLIADACKELVQDYVQFAADAVNSRSEETETVIVADTTVKDSDNIAANDSFSSSEETENNHSNDLESLVKRMPDSPDSIWSLFYLHRFFKESLPIHPIVNGLSFYAADLFRGMQGTLNSCMEFFYTHLLENFVLLSTEAVSSTGEEVVSSLNIILDSLTPAADGDSIYQHPSAVEKITEIIKETGSLALKQALVTVLLETRKQSTREETDDDEEEDMATTERESSQSDRPSHRLLSAVVQSFHPNVHYLHIVNGLLQSGNYLLWRDPREDRLLKSLARSLSAELKQINALSSPLSDSVSHHLSLCGGVLELLLSLCLSPYVTGELDFGKPQEGKVGRAVEVQQLFIGVGKDVVEQVSRIAFRLKESPSTASSKAIADADAAQTLLLSFAQDILSKNYSFSQAEERRLNERQFVEQEYSANKEESPQRETNPSVKSFLTPLALTLLRSTCGIWWESLSDALEPFCKKDFYQDAVFHRSTAFASFRLVERGILLLRMMCDRTHHSKTSPLIQILRLKTVQSVLGKGKGLQKSISSSEINPIVLHLQNILLRAGRWFVVNSKAMKKDEISTVSTSNLWVKMAYSTVSEMLACLLPISTIILRTQISADFLGSWTALLQETQEDIVLGSIGSMNYFVHTQISLHLLQLSTSFVGSEESEAPKMFSMGLLSKTIDALYLGFQSVTESNVLPLDGWENTTSLAPPSSDSTRSQLYRSAETLMEALEFALHLQDSVGNNRSMYGGEVASLDRREMVLEAARILKVQLSVEVQEHLSYILLESLVAPLQSLRVSTLRLLRLLCDETLVEPSNRLAGLSALDVSVLTAIREAECYNPLSQSGNMDGLRGTMNPVVSLVQRRKITDPFSMIVLGRSMLGFFYLKFSEAWSIAQLVLGELSKVRCDNMEVSAEKISFWNDVVHRYARMLAIGDVVERNEERRIAVPSDSGLPSDVSSLSKSSEEKYQSDAAAEASLASYRLYKISLTDQQRHEKGEMISRAFSSVVYRASRYTIVDLPQDGEVISWDAHYRQVHLVASSVRAAVYSGSTDAAMVAKNFLAVLSRMAESFSSASEERFVLLVDLLKEISSIFHNDHKSGVSLFVKRIDERVELALQACGNAPSPAVSGSEAKKLTESQLAWLKQCVRQLTALCSSYLSEDNNRLQRAAIDLLKRLKVEPFFTYHQNLYPFADNMKALFSFTSTFHLETDINPRDKPSFVSAVMTIALPKLVAKVSKEKFRDQAVLRRQILSFLRHVSSETEQGHEALNTVVTQLFQRLVLSDESQKFELHDLRFLKQWESRVQQNIRQACRFMERLQGKLLSTLQLLESIINSVGSEFSSSVGISFSMSIEAYLVACKQNLMGPIQKELDRHSEEGESSEESQSLLRLRQSLNFRLLSNTTSQIRRSAVQVVASLMEQFPEQVMSCIQQYYFTSGVPPRESVFGKYIRMLFQNSKGTTHGKRKTEGGSSSSKAHTTPLLRLLRSWLSGPSLFPLIPLFGEEMAGTFQELFALRAENETSGPVYKAQTQDIIEALRCLADILSVADETFVCLSEQKQRKKTPTFKSSLRTLFVMPFFNDIFTSLYRLIVRGAEGEETVGAPKAASTHIKTIMSFPPQLWRELLRTVTSLSSLSRSASEEEQQLLHNIPDMQEKLLEIAIRFAQHPLCITDRATLTVALEEMERLVDSLAVADSNRHYYPIVRLFNIIPVAPARLLLCRIFSILITKLPLYSTAGPQLDAVSRAVSCLNSFEDLETLDRYDFDLRYHTFNSLKKFFLNDESYGSFSSSRGSKVDPKSGCAVKQSERQERDYSGSLDVRIPVDGATEGVLAVEGLAIVASNIMFFLRDSEGTIRVFSRNLLQAMMQYITRIKSEALQNEVLEKVTRRLVLPSLRQGVVARDVHIRGEHISAFGILAKWFPSVFPSFAQLASPNSEENFYSNVAHPQPKLRLNALAILRKKAGTVQVRDLLRVFIPFLVSAVKDFAQGKRELQNLTEGKAKGYCDAVLMTIASISQHLPWMVYHRVLMLLLENAGSNPDLRLPMLRGVVQVLDNFHFLDDDKELEKADVIVEDLNEGEEPDGEDVKAIEGEKEAGSKGQTGKTNRYYHAQIVRSLESDILPRLLEFICPAKARREMGVTDNLGGQHTISSVRREQERKLQDATKNSIIQLPVAIAIAKIVKKLPEERCNEYMDMLLNEVIAKLRTKNDKQRESARRILGVMVQETGPGKLGYVIKVLKGHLVHGYQLHVLGYTIVTLLYQLYEPDNALLKGTSQLDKTKVTGITHAKGEKDVIEEAIELMSKLQKGEARDEHKSRSEAMGQEERENFEETRNGREKANDRAEALISRAEEQLIQQLVPVSARFDPEFGVKCLTDALDELLMIFLDDYLGEIGHQKEQIELMSKMVEIKKNRAVQGFCLLARHAHAETMMKAFIERIRWVLTPPAESEAMLSKHNASQQVRMIIKAEIQKKYTTVGKAATADIVFVHKVRTLSLSVAKGFLMNPTLNVEHALDQVRFLVDSHNKIREDRIRAFEAKDGTRRIRGNAHMLIQSAPHQTLQDQRDSNFLILPEPEKVDVDFISHTVLTTQQKQKLKVYKGRYAKEVERASKDFYREDAVTAVVLDTLDEFLLRVLLSMLRKVLGIGRDKKRHSVVELDLLRRKRSRLTEEAVEEEEEVNLSDELQESEEGLNPSLIQEDGDDLDAFASHNTENLAPVLSSSKVASAPSAPSVEDILPDVNAAFTKEHHNLLQSLLVVVLTALEGEGSDAVVAHALDAVLALISLRPPLNLGKENERLLQTVSMYFDRGGPIKQRAMRVCAGIIAHQRFSLTNEEAKRMVQLIRGEVVDRSDHLAMALSLLYSIMGKHVVLVEIYDLIDLLTELLLHLSNKRFIRSRCILILVRFLTEYKLTPQKFCSHIDLICRNLDFPEMGGRLALLDLLDALIVRLPVVVLREQAPVLIIPLAALVSQGEFEKDRQRAGEVLQTLVKLAGIDVVAPTLQNWLDSSNSRPIRTMGTQAVALCMTALQNVYGTLPDGDPLIDHFEGSVDWCLPLLLEACRYEPVPPKAIKGSKMSKAKQMERWKNRGWSLIFYALRALEAVTATAPSRIYPKIAAELMPIILERRLVHPHGWVKGVACRILNHYCYSFVDAHNHYLLDSIPSTPEHACDEEKSSHLPLILYHLDDSSDLMGQMMAALKRLLTVVEQSDVGEEKHHANLAIDHASRAELLRSVIFALKGLQQSCLALLVSSNLSPSAKNAVQSHYTSLTRLIKSIAAPVLRQGSVVNYVVRCASLVQIFGGYAGVLPRGAGDDELYNRASRWLVESGSGVLSLMHTIASPLLQMGIAASVLSHRLSNIAYQSSKVIQHQLEERRALWGGSEKKSQSNLESKKRKRSSDSEAMIDVDEVIAAFLENETATHEDLKVKRIKKEVRKNLVKNKHEELSSMKKKRMRSA